MTRRTAGLLAAAVLTAAAWLLVVRAHPGGPTSARDVDDLGQLASAALASACCVLRARRRGTSSESGAASWWLLAAGTGSWAVGEVIWSYYEVLADRETPFPSPADVGYLLFPLIAGIGLLRWPSAVLRGGARWRALLDGVLVAGSLFVISWVTALGSTVRAVASPLSYAVAVAYPVSDLVLLTLTVMVLVYARSSARSGLVLLSAGLLALSVADSGFAYLTALGTYRTGSVVDVGWTGGFLLLAVAARVHTVDDAVEARESAATVRALIPYVAAGAGLVVAVGAELTGHGQRLTLVVALLVMLALLGRQVLAVLDNRRLVRALVEAQTELRHQAFHDPLTGLANRALFTDRMRHAVALHERDGRPLGLLYADLDGFKAVNDGSGHDAGDAVLRATAERLRAVTRPGDTVARMGGDEFAILLEDGEHAAAVAERILAAFAQPAVAAGCAYQLGASIGVTDLLPGDAPVAPAELLRRADIAMYAVKRGGKNDALAWRPELDPDPDAEPSRPTTPRRIGHPPLSTAQQA